MTKANIGNSELISEVNTRLVLHAVRQMQPTYRAEVSRRTRLKPATVTGIVNALLAQDLLQEVPGSIDSGPRGGRPPMMLRVNGDHRHILAIDLEPDCIRVALTNMLVQVLEYREQLIDRFSEPSIVIRQIRELCRQVLKATSPDRLHGAGMSLPGLINRDQGELISTTNMPKWRHVPIAQLVGKQVGITPKVERSIHLAALYEDWSAPAQHHATTLILSLRTGIGMSFIHRGQLYRGMMGFDGEIGHTVVDINGKDCECGSRGCLETLVSASAVCERVQRMLADGRCRAVKHAMDENHEPLRPELVYRLAKEGDPDCVDIVRDVGRYIGIAAANMINLMAPKRLVICGAIDTADDLILAAVRREIEQHSLPQLREHLSIGLAAAKEKSPLLGAAVLVARDLFDLPRLEHPVKRLVETIEDTAVVAAME